MAPLARPLILALAVVAALGCRTRDGRPGGRILCLGDSITAGITYSTADGEMRRDVLGGYPGRLARRLDGGVRVLQRGVGGATAARWLSPPRATDGRSLWPELRTLWPDLGPEPAPAAASFAAAVLRADRPDTVIILLGINDLATEGPTRGPEIAGVVAERLVALRAEALAVARTALVATVLPNRRDPPDLREGLNARIRTSFPDYLPLGERFSAEGWERLLDDEVHPNEDGCEVLADILAEELVRRELVPGRAGG